MSRAVLQVFEEYQSNRTRFVQKIAELASRPQNIEALQNAGVMSLLRPLLMDNVPSIQQSSALALGRLANYSESLAEAVVDNDVLPQLVGSLAEQNRYYKKAAAFVIRAVAKHSPELAARVVEAGALDPLVQCLSEFDPDVKEAAACALGFLARHNAEQAQALVDSGAVSSLVLCLQEPELALKRVSASSLSEISKHTPDLAQAVIDAGAVQHLAPMVQHHDPVCKKKACSALAQIAKHSVDRAEVVVEAKIFPDINHLLQDLDVGVRKNAATLIREIAKHTAELARLIVTSKTHVAIIEFIKGEDCTGTSRLPGIMALGYISAFHETLALSVIEAHGVEPLKDALIHEPEDYIKAAAAWSLGQVGRHTPDHALALAHEDIFRDLIEVYRCEDSSEDLRQKCQRALKGVLQKCTKLSALEPLLDLDNCPPKILKYVVQQFAKVLPNDPKHRKSFVTSGGLRKVQELAADAESGSKLEEYVSTINSCFPTEIVQYYSPNYSETLLKKLDEHDQES